MEENQELEIEIKKTDKVQKTAVLKEYKDKIENQLKKEKKEN